MHTTQRPDRHDWFVGILASAALGACFLGVGARIGMRIIANAIGQPASFTLEGSIAVVLLGAATGALVGAIFLGARSLFPGMRWARTLLFWSVCLLLMLRGLKPVSILNASVFLPLLLAHGALLHLYWCRVHLRRNRLPSHGWTFRNAH